MIDPETETVIPFRDVPNHLPRRNGKKINLSTLYRWKTSGLCGVQLEVFYRAGIPHTSLEAIRRFDELVTKAKSSSLPKDAISDVQARIAHEIAKKRLSSIASPQHAADSRSKRKRNSQQNSQRQP